VNLKQNIRLVEVMADTKFWCRIFGR